MAVFTVSHYTKRFMSILTVTNVAKSFGSDLLFSNVTFKIEAGQKMGLVGRNGCGKTTLLRILLGQEVSDASPVPTADGTKMVQGKATLAHGRRLGYLRQEAPVHPEHTIMEEIQTVFAPVRALEAQLGVLEEAMTDAGDDALLEAAMNEYARVRDAFDAAGGYHYADDLDLVLQKLGFRPADMDKRVGACSGGEQTRLALAKIVLSRPDLLVLDEPTNHLDIAATEWLEGFLRAYEEAVLLVSHDRYFLDAVADTIGDLEDQKLTVYKGNYSHYHRQKEELLARQQALYEQQQAEINRLEAVIKRNMGADSVSSAMRHKMQGRIEKMDKVERTRVDTSAVAARFDADSAGRIGRDVVRMEGLGKSYGERALFSNLNCLVERGDRVGVVGPNGAGKTTLVKILLGTEQPTRGALTLGHNVRLAYFSQHAADNLNPSHSVLEAILDMVDMTETEARSYLARFLFTGDDVFKLVGMLSGGEKNKLALARMILSPCNLLILDEPTNHLDIASCEALTGMLSQYAGTLMLVSHDRYLLNATTTKTLALLGAMGGEAGLFEGNYAAWRDQTREPVPAKPARTAKPAAPAPKSNGTARAAVIAPPPAALNARELSKARVRARELVLTTEASVNALETRIASTEERLAKPSGSVADMVALAAEHTRLQDNLLAALAAWEQAVSEQEALGE